MNTEYNLFLSLIKRFTIDSINTLIFTNNLDYITEIYSSLVLKDLKLNKELYEHIYDLGIKKLIHYSSVNNYFKNNKINKNIIIENIYNNNLSNVLYNTLIIDNKDYNITIQIIENNIKNINTTIIINKYNNEYNFEYKNWHICNEFKDTNIIILKYNNPVYFINNKDKLYYFYELMYYLDKFFIKHNINYFAIKSSCLGCIRNKSHIIFCDKIHICIDIKKKDIFNIDYHYFNNLNTLIKYYENNIYLILNDAIIKIHFYSNNNNYDFIINNEKTIYSNEVNNTLYYNYGPIRIKSLNQPISYLKRIYGNDVFTILKHNNFIIYNPKFLYDCYYNQWSSYTSDYWKEKQLDHLYKIYNCLKLNNIKCWIDCGTLLGAARNRFICLFDDDTDIGVFYKDLEKVHKILDNNNIKLYTKLNFINNISFDEFYNLKISYNEKENINYNFYTKNDLYCEFRAYQEYNNTYISLKDKNVSDAHHIDNLLEKRAVDKNFFDNLESIKLGKYIFDCPSNYKIYLESTARYGINSILGNPIRDCKPGNIVLYDDFL